MKKVLSFALAALISCAVSAQNKAQTPQQSSHSKPTVEKPNDLDQLILKRSGLQTEPAVSTSVNKSRTNAPDQNPSLNGQQNIDPGYYDGRNLPLNDDGQLMSVDGHAVEFKKFPNPNDPGVCGTQSPYVRDPNPMNRAGCPFVVPCDNPNNRDTTTSNGTLYFMLRWTIVRNAAGDANSNIDSARVDALMTELNNDFAAYNMVFCRENLNFVNDATYHDLNVGSEDAGLKNTYGANPGQVINIYVVNQISNPNAGGYARFPYDPFGGYNIRGGVVMGRSNSSLGTHTLAHELGHTFGLEHTFHGVDEVTPCTACYEGNDNNPVPGASTGGDTEGDWCQDTNPHPTNSYVCGDQGTDACAPGNPWQNSPVDNHMSYSFCTSTFSAQQHRRMRCMIYSYLSQWTAYGGGTCGNLPPVAQFTGTPLYGTAPHTVNYTDLSSPAQVITTWTWDFDVTGLGGVTPATFTGQNPPAVVYANPGIYTVELTITSPSGNDTETKSMYVEVISPPNTCDTLNTQWETPTSNPSVYNFGAGDYVTGLPSATLQAAPTDPLEYTERFASAGPGTTVGGVRVGLGNYYDLDSNTTFDIFVWDDNAGEPDWLATPTNNGFLGGRTGLDPGAIGIPAGLSFTEVWIPFFNEVPIPNNFFHVGININQGDGSDTLIVVSSAQGQGEGDNSNHVWSSNFGTISYQNDVGLDFDLDIVPLLSEYTPVPIVIDYIENAVCDTTYATIVDTVYYTDWTNLNSLTYTFSDGQTFTFDNIPANGIPDIQVTDTVNLVFTQPGPIDFTITAVSEDCGRIDSTDYTLNYTFNESPDPDFSMSNTNPVCEGDVVNFTATPGTMSDYTWDFGDGTVASSGASATTTHTYTTSGLYYVTLTITDANGCTGQIQRWDYVEVVNCSVPAPVADFSMDVNSGCTPLTVNFTDLSANSPTSWVWDFGDGNFSTQQNPTHTFTTAGTYNVSLFATNTGGTDQVTYVVTVDDPLDASFTFNDFCAGAANGPTGVVTPGGTFSFNPAPSDGATIDPSTGVISNGVGGTTYTVEYAVVNGTCTNTSTQNVTVNPLDDASFTFNNYCEGAANGPTGVAAPGGTWDFNPTPSDGATINASTGEISNGVAGTTYTVEYTTSGTCPTTSTETVTVIAIDDPSFTFNSFCEGAANGPTAIATPGGTWAFNPLPGDGATINSSTGEISNEVGGTTYTVEYTTGGTCPATTTVDVDVLPLDDASFTFNDFCVTGSNGPTGIATPGGSFAFGTPPGDGATINNSTGVISNPVAGNSYQVEYTTSGACPNTSTVTVNAVGVSYTSTVQDENCGASDGEIDLVASGGFGPTYQYSIDGGSTFQSGNGVFTGLTAGTYNIVIEDGSGCQTTGTVTVSTVSGPVISNPIVTNPTCNGACDGSISVTVTGGTPGYTYIWTDGGGNPVGGNSPSVTNLCAGSYNLEVQDASGSCSAFGSYTLTNPPAEDPSFTFPDYCEGSANGPGTVADPGGTFAFNPVPTDGATIDPSTGEISNGVGGTTYTVEYTTGGPCPQSSTQTVTVDPLDDASFTFNDYCAGSANGPTGIATPGGSWAFNPVPSDGATINGATGVISGGVGGTTYTVEYTTSGACPNTNTQTVTVNATGDASFTFNDFCEGSANGPTGVATSGGTWSFNPVPSDGATIDPSTGEISNETGGSTYTIQYTTSGACPGTSTVNVTVNTLDDASFSFADYCEGASNGPTGVATPGGTFGFNPAPGDGASIDPSTGVISNGVGGSTYTVEYTTSGPCPNTTTVNVTVNPQDDATFTFNDFCIGAANGPSNVQTSGGTWAFNPAPTDGATINASTGEISNETVGTTYTVEYSTSGICPDTHIETVTVTASDDATFTFNDFCVGQSNSPTAIQTPGGTFAFNPVPSDGATIDPSTGVISNGVAGTSYVVEYTTPAGPCQSSSTVTVTVLTQEDATFTYSDTLFCQSDPNPTPTITGTSGGSFSGPVGVSINTSTGVINLNGSTPGGPYTIQYITPGQCADTATFDVYVGSSTAFADAGGDITVCDTTAAVTLNGNDPGSMTGTWSFISGSGTITNPNDSASTVTGLSSAGVITLEWFITDGSCSSDSDTVNITVNECEEIDTELSIPTAFTPDGDGTNDVWNLDNIDQYPDATVVVFNRWGNEVYRSGSPYEPWDGLYNDQLLPTGSYYYIINLNDGSEPLSGAVTIIK